ncbi:putative lactoylglutathione lyase, chloroplastic [Glycine soja]
MVNLFFFHHHVMDHFYGKRTLLSLMDTEKPEPPQSPVHLRVQTHREINEQDVQFSPPRPSTTSDGMDYDMSPVLSPSWVEKKLQGKYSKANEESASCQSYCLAFFITRKWNMRSVNEESLIDETSKATTNERPNPVNPMISPVASNQSRPKRSCGVHRSSGVSPTSEDVGPHYKPNQCGPKPSKCSLLGIHHGRIHTMASSLMLPAASMLRPCTTLSSSCASSRRLALFHLVSTGGIALPQAQLFGAEKIAQPEKNLFDWVKNDNRRFLHVVYRVGDLEKTIKKKEGRLITREPGPVKDGSAVIALIEDPDGYKFELLERRPTSEPLCQVMLRVGDIDRAVGMKLLRKRDNPEQKYTVAFMGYGPEYMNSVLELTYNYGVTNYDKGNGYAQIAIGTNDVYKTAEAIKLCGRKIIREPGPLPGINTKIVACLDPDGWKLAFVDNVDFLKELE